MAEVDYLQFEPKVHDFGDNYHKPDSELYTSMDEAVRTIRRKYRHYSDYVKAIRTIEDYLEKLVAKYGGPTNFKMAMQMKNVKEFIPPIPRFRSTEENLLYSKYGIVMSEQVFDVDYDLSEDHVQAVENESRFSGNGFGIVVDKYGYSPVKIKSTSEIFDEGDKYAQELDMLTEFANNPQYASGKKKKRKKSSHNLLKEAKRRKKMMEKINKPKTVGDLIDDYNRDVLGLGPDDDELNYVIYRGVAIPTDEMDNINVTKAMQQSGLIGGNELSSINSKKIRKMLKKENRTKKKKKHDVDMDDFLEDYNSSDKFGMAFGAFQKEMAQFTSDQME